MQDRIVKNPSWWKRRTRLEKLLLVLVVSSFIIGLALCISLIIVRNRLQTEQICVTSGCIKTASQILDRMNASVDPCDDFYQFACGNFVANTPIPKDKTSVYSFSIINDKVIQQLREVLEEPSQESELRAFLLAKKFYQSCLDESSIEYDGLTPARHVLAQLDGWPVLEGDKWKEEDFNWTTLLYKMKNIGLDTNQVFTLDLDEDPKNNTRYVIQIGQVLSDGERQILLKDYTEKVLKAFYEYMVNIAVSFGAYRKFAEGEIFAAIEFARKLANITLPAEDMRNASQLYNLMTIEEMQNKYPNIPWLEYINTLLYPTVQVGKDEDVIVKVPKYIEQLDQLMKDEPKRAVANYIIGQGVESLVLALPDHIRKYKLGLQTQIFGITEDPPRWQQCVQNTYQEFTLAVSSLYVRKYFKPESKQKVLDMVKDIKESFLDILKNLNWMDEITRQKAIDKADVMKVHMAYPDELLDDNELNKFYATMHVNDSFLESILLTRQFSYHVNWSFLRKPVNNSMWITHGNSATVNAFYDFGGNGIMFPAGILQDVFFSDNRPNYLNYGSIGSVIGHEITHGFDDQGRQYDKNGMLVNWWTPETENSFLNKTQCIINQYDDFIVPEIHEHLKGITTQGENIADNGGMKEAYKAYRRYQTRHGEEPQLPGLPYNPRQMFWLSAAGTWCSADRPDFLKMQIYDEHSPARFRVIGPMSNIEEFSLDWGCAKGTGMNPEKKCQVW